MVFALTAVIALEDICTAILTIATTCHARAAWRIRSAIGATRCDYIIFRYSPCHEQ